MSGYWFISETDGSYEINITWTNGSVDAVDPVSVRLAVKGVPVEPVVELGVDVVVDCCWPDTELAVDVVCWRWGFVSWRSWFIKLLTSWLTAPLGLFIWKTKKVSEWLLYNAKCAIYQLYQQNTLQCDDDRFVLNQQAKLDFYSASSMKQHSTDRHVAPLWHSMLI